METEEAPAPEPIELNEKQKRALLMKAREDLYDRTFAERQKINRFETQINRDYFHVKPVAVEERKTWEEYLKYMEDAIRKDTTTAPRLKKTFARCLVSCAIYPEFWTRYARALADLGEVEAARATLESAHSRYCKNNAKIVGAYAAFEEEHGSLDRARAFFKQGVELASSDVNAVLALARFERRRADGDYTETQAVYEAALERFSAKDQSFSKPQFTKLSLQYSNFLRFASQDQKKAETIVRTAVEADKTNPTLWTVLIDICSSQADEKAVCSVFEDAIKAVPASEMTQLLWARYVDYLQSCGSDVADIASVQQRAPKPTASKKRKASGGHYDRRWGGHYGQGGHHGHQKRRHY